MQRFHLYFSGRVQGVGFRFTARYLANKHSIKGWVMNLAGGGVELEIEGKKDDLNSFLKDLQDEFKDYIIDFKREELPFSGKFKDFQIKIK